MGLLRLFFDVERALDPDFKDGLWGENGVFQGQSLHFVFIIAKLSKIALGLTPELPVRVRD